MKPEKNKKNPKADKRGAGGKGGKGGKDAPKEKKVEVTFTCGGTKKKGPKVEEKLDDATKEFYLAQINALEHQLERYHRLCDQLEIKLGEIKTFHDERDQQKSDIISHLDRTLAKRSDELSSTGKQLQDLQLTSHVERQEFEAQILQLNQTLQETKDRMNNEIDTLKIILKSTEKYQLEKEEVELKMEMMMEEMEETRAAQRNQLYTFERQRVVDINRLRQDMHFRVNNLAAAFGADVKHRIRQTTHAAIQENVDASQQVEVHAKTTRLLIKENDALKREALLLKRKIETMEMVEKDITRRNCSLKEVLRLMRDRYVAMETVAKESVQLRLDYESALKTIEDLTMELKTTKDSQQMLTIKSARLASALTQANELTVSVNRVNIQLRRLLSEAAFVVRKALETSSSEDCVQSNYEITDKRNAVVYQLSVLFGTAAVLGVDRDLVDEVAEQKEVDEEEEEEDVEEEEEEEEVVEARRPTCNVDAATAFRRVITSQRPSRVLPARWRQQSLSPQYRPGDIGAIPLHPSTQKPRIRSATDPSVKTTMATKPSAPRFSLVNRITAALLDQ